MQANTETTATARERRKSRDTFDRNEWLREQYYDAVQERGKYARELAAADARVEETKAALTAAGLDVP